MLYDSIKMLDGANINNASIISGASLPLTGDVGELFYLTAGNSGLYIYNSSEWVIVRIGQIDPGVPAGGTSGQILSKVDDANYNMQWINPPAGTGGGGGGGRETLNSARTYYASPIGNDNNDGLSSGSPITLQTALDRAGLLDFTNYDVTIQLLDGTYTGPFFVRGWSGSGELIVQGNVTTQSNTVLTTSTGHTFYASFLKGQVRVKAFRVQNSTGAQSGIFVGQMTKLLIDTGMEFGAVQHHQITATSGGAIEAVGDYSIVGGGLYHIYLNDTAQSYVRLITVTITGNPTFAAAFCGADANASARFWTVVWSGNAVGIRYLVRMSSSLWTYGAGTNHLPGTQAGTASDGGVYA